MNGIFFISDLANLNRLDDTGVTYNSYNSKCGVNHIGMQARRHFGNHNDSTKEVLKTNHLQMIFVWPPAKKSRRQESPSGYSLYQNILFRQLNLHNRHCRHIDRKLALYRFLYVKRLECDFFRLAKIVEVVHLLSRDNLTLNRL